MFIGWWQKRKEPWICENVFPQDTTGNEDWGHPKGAFPPLAGSFYVLHILFFKEKRTNTSELAQAACGEPKQTVWIALFRSTEQLHKSNAFKLGGEAGGSLKHKSTNLFYVTKKWEERMRKQQCTSSQSPERMISAELGSFRYSLFEDDLSCQFPADACDIYWRDRGS